MSAPGARGIVMPAPGPPGKEASEPAIEDEEFQHFQEYFYSRTGIVFGNAKRYFVDRRLIDRMAATGSASLRTYMSHLKYHAGGAAELQHLINAMTVNETYFYREEYQFQCLVNSILPEIVARRPPHDTRPLRLWSLPCSTGEEPYSIAISLLQNWREVDRYNVEIVASDIDTHVLASARAGVYDDRSVQYLSAAIRSRYFSRPAEGRWRLRDDVRGSVDFVPVNLSDRLDMRRHTEAFDVIFCRNLLIYFDDISRRQAANALFDALRPGGFLCLGHSESMSRISALFIVRKFPDAIVYQKPAR
jgi:chemotaxis protein methyltransferase CheR